MVTLPPGVALGPTSAAEGRSVVSTRAVRPGGVIAVFSDTGEHATPTVTIPDSSQLSNTCSYCMAMATPAAAANTTNTPTGLRMRACTGCHTSHYCSVKCQRADWAMAHKHGECKAFQRARASIGAATGGPSAAGGGGGGGGMGWLTTFPTPVRALIQVLVRPDLAAAVAEMEGHVEKVRRGAGEGVHSWPSLQIQAGFALPFLGRDTDPRSVAEATEIVCKLKINSFTRADGDMTDNGLYANPALALVNHDCIPNAFVVFEGRSAILRAYEEIKEGEQVKISYISTTIHRSERRAALRAQYYFNCRCTRCLQDLDVYEVCRRYPNLELNTFSLVPGLNKLPIPPFRPLDKSLRAKAEEIYPSCSTSLAGQSARGKSAQLRQRWRVCARLREDNAYALEPLTQILAEANIYFTEEKNFGYSLTIACFLALNSDPYQRPMPFHDSRLKGMLMIARLLANAAAPSPSASAKKTTGTLSAKISKTLGTMDPVTICHTILAMIIHYCTECYSKEGVVYRSSKDLLDDIESLPGRETEKALVNAFLRNPTGPEEKRFFETVVLDPIRRLAGFALEVMDAEFGR